MRNTVWASAFWKTEQTEPTMWFSVTLDKNMRILLIVLLNGMTCRPQRGVHRTQQSGFSVCPRSDRRLEQMEQIRWVWSLTCLPSELIVSMEPLCLFTATKHSPTIKVVLIMYWWVLSLQWTVWNRWHTSCASLLLGCEDCHLELPWHYTNGFSCVTWSSRCSEYQMI